jgi:hypothetical protein
MTLRGQKSAIKAYAPTSFSISTSMDRGLGEPHQVNPIKDQCDASQLLGRTENSHNNNYY